MYIKKCKADYERGLKIINCLEESYEQNKISDETVGARIYQCLEFRKRRTDYTLYLITILTIIIFTFPRYIVDFYGMYNVLSVVFLILLMAAVYFMLPKIYYNLKLNKKLNSTLQKIRLG